MLIAPLDGDAANFWLGNDNYYLNKLKFRFLVGLKEATGVGSSDPERYDFVDEKIIGKRFYRNLGVFPWEQNRPNRNRNAACVQ